jgi:hypothetical protein
MQAGRGAADKMMGEIKNLQGVSPADAAQLEAIGIETLDDLWRCVGVNFDEGVSKVAAEATVAPELLYSLLIAASFGEVRQAVEGRPFSLWRLPKLLWVYAGRFWQSRGRRWAETLLAVGTLLLAVLAIRSGYVSPETAEQVVVAPAVSLAPFQLINAENVVLKRVPKEQKSFAVVNDVAGRYSLRNLAPGTTLKDEHLLARNLSAAMANRQVLSIPVNRKALSPWLNPPGHVWLLLSPRAPTEKSPQPVLLKDVLLLSIDLQTDTSSVTVAVKEDGLDAMRILLGASEVFVSKPIE